MGHRFLETLTTPAVRAAQEANGSRRSYARMEGGPDHNNLLGEAEAGFIAARDSFYIASVSESGWPYIQHRGGPQGFLKVLDARRLGFADYRGNRQYITLGNASVEDRVALFLMDYPNRRRLKLLGRMAAIDAASEPALAPAPNASSAKVERAFIIRVEAFDWNCPQHITPRFSETDLQASFATVREHLARLEADNIALRSQVADLTQGKTP